MIDENKYEAEIAYFRARMRNIGVVPLDVIRAMVRDAPFPDISGNPELAEQMVRYLEEYYVVSQQKGVMIRKHGHDPWWGAARESEGFDPHYWSRLDKFLREKKGLPPSVVGVLDGDTNEILDHLGNPRDSAHWQKRGMVLGHVQSGKTTNYSALICKAADAGYEVVILLSGTSNLLRAQTQQRIDEAFIGRKTGFRRQGVRPSDIVGVGEYTPHTGRTPPISLTSMEGDFSREVVTKSGINIGSVSEPIIFVTKKNAKSLFNLKEWIRRNRPGGGRIDSPLLLIDDEADNASINTRENPDEFTRINGEIRGILDMFTRASYVGYTATPFANIFIMPDSDEDMTALPCSVGDTKRLGDLFPSDFIMALDPPDNYVGPDKVFAGDEYSDNMLRQVDDYHDAFPAKHKKTQRVKELPESLRTAVRLFVLCRAFMSVAGQTGHSTMMVNVSHFNDVQESVRGKIHEYLTVLKNAIRMHARTGSDGNNQHMEDLCRDFESEYADKGYSWSDIRPHLSAAGGIDVVTVNMRGGALDYATHWEHGLHVIAVGGFALSRGLTLEGLRISYLTRNAGAYDTLMQMGRWFGYRGASEDFCRVFMPANAIERYTFVSDAIQELREDIKLMNSLKETPRDFGLRVRQSPATALQITARNKMRNAESVRLAVDFRRKHVEAHTIFEDKKINAENFSRIRTFAEKLGEPTSPPGNRHKHHLFWRDVGCREVLNFILGFKLPNKNADFIRTGGTLDAPQTFVSEFITEREDEFRLWDVCLSANPIPQKGVREGVRVIGIAGRKIALRKREKGSVSSEGAFYRIASKRMVDREDAAVGLTQAQLDEVDKAGENGKLQSHVAYNQKRERPLLLLHLFDAFKRDSTSAYFGDIPAVSYSICFPPSDIPAKEKKYAVNIVGQQQCLNFGDDLYAGAEKDE